MSGTFLLGHPVYSTVVTMFTAGFNFQKHGILLTPCVCALPKYLQMCTYIDIFESFYLEDT